MKSPLADWIKGQKVWIFNSAKNRKNSKRAYGGTRRNGFYPLPRKSSKAVSRPAENWCGNLPTWAISASTFPRTSAVWVLLPALISTNTWIWAYWGDPIATLPPYATDGTVWTNDYSVVLHLSDAAGAPVLDSSPQSVAATFGPWEGSWSWGHSGAIGNSAQYLHLLTFMSLGAGVSLGAEWTLSSWFKDLDGPAYQRVLSETTAHDSPVAIPSGGTALGAYFYLGQDEPCGYSLSPPAGEWHHVTAAGDAAGTRYFIDGEQVGAITNHVSGTLRSVGNGWTGSAPYRFAEYIDEFRISSVARSTNWIAACWLNQSTNGTFVTFGTAELQHPSGEPDPDSDGDGMLDAWEDEHLGGTAAACCRRRLVWKAGPSMVMPMAPNT